MKRSVLVLCGLVLALAAPTSAQTKWAVAFNAGLDMSLAGDVHGGGTGRVLNLPTIVESRSYNGIYGHPFTWSVDFGYTATPNGEARVKLFRTTGSAEGLQVGTVSGLPLLAQFNDYTALGVDFGYRQYLMSGAWRPFVGGSVGFVNVDQNSGTFSVPAANVTLPNVSMTGASTVLTFAASGGVTYPLGGNFEVQGGVDFRWHGDLDPVEGLAGSGLQSINDETRRWSAPVTAGVIYRF
jgi:hypothetical protein